MENAMHDSRRYRDSAAECPLAAQEASQPDYRKLLISMARRMRLWTITFVVIFVSLGSSPALAEDSKPSFLQAAIFFITGREPPNDVQLLSDSKAVVRDAIDAIYPSNQAFRLARHEYVIIATRPCTVFGFLVEPPYAAIRVEFTTLPSPRAIRVLPSTNIVMDDLPHQTWCKAKAQMSEGEVKIIPGTSMCATQLSFVVSASALRRMDALDYIRANFCAAPVASTSRLVLSR
jgi:hypothetical protein